MELPKFKYHPDPIRTGSVISSSETCTNCGKRRGFVYTGPIYGTGDTEEPICPWCIADGSAHDQLDFEFTDGEMVGGGGIWEEVPVAVVEEVAYRTPGFAGWQQELWFTHCGDAAAFLGRVGYEELIQFGSEAGASFREATGLTDEVWKTHFPALEKDGSPTGYLFQCLHCGKYGGYTDAD